MFVGALSAIVVFTVASIAQAVDPGTSVNLGVNVNTFMLLLITVFTAKAGSASKKTAEKAPTADEIATAVIKALDCQGLFGRRGIGRRGSDHGEDQ